MKRIGLLLLAVAVMAIGVFAGQVARAEEPLTLAPAETPAAAPAAAAPDAAAGELALKIRVRRDARKIALAYVIAHRGATEDEIEAAVIEGVKAKAAAGDYGKLADEKDWAAFFEALADFLERIMPLIMELIDAFGA